MKQSNGLEWGWGGGDCSAVGLFAFRRGCQRGLSGGVEDSEERGWDILLRLQLPQGVAPQWPWACAGKLKDC